MVQITTSALVSLLLVAPSLAVPVVHSFGAEHPHPHHAGHHTHSGELASTGPHAHVHAHRHLHHPTGELTQRDIEFLQDLAARDPNFFKKMFKKIGHVVNPKNLLKVGKFAAGLVLREDELAELLERDSIDLEDLEELAARDPSFGSLLRKAKKVVNVRNIRKAAGFASNFIREDGLDGDVVEFTARDLEMLEDLAARDPSIFGKIARRVKHVVSAKNIGKIAGIAGKVGNVASNFIREDESELLERDYSDFELNELD